MDLALSSANHYVIRNLLPPDQASGSLKVMVLNQRGIHTRAGTEVRLFTPGTRHLLGTRIIETGSGYNAQSVRPAHFGIPGQGTVDVELTLMTKGGRRIVLIEAVDPSEHVGGYLSVKVDGEGRVVR
jgi:hypothetical protein